MTHGPTRVITVEREYGSHGGEFAHDLAAHLGWRLLDSELPCAAARAAGVPPELAAKYDERLDPWYYRYGKVFWHDSGYSIAGLSDDQVFDSERMLSLIRQHILTAAKEGNCVIVGRGAACALANQAGCFHVFVYATAQAKRDWFVQTFPKQAGQAYQQEWCARGLYHLLLNSAIGNGAMIAAVGGATRLIPAVVEESVAV